MSGVVPAHAPRRASPAITPSSTRRATRAAGQRSRPCTPRVSTGTRPPARDRSRIHGRSRGSSMASCRRSTTTVRRSCIVAAKRSWPTRCDRRSAASSEVCPSRAMPTTTSTIARAIGSQAERWTTRAARARARRRARPVPTRCVPSPLATLSPTSTTPSTVAIHGRSRTPLATKRGAGGRARRAWHRPARRCAIHAAVVPSMRWCASWPAMAPVTVPTNSRNRRRRIAGARSAAVRSTGASSTWRTSARSSASGPPKLPDRSPTATTNDASDAEPRRAVLEQVGRSARR